MNNRSLSFLIVVLLLILAGAFIAYKHTVSVIINPTPTPTSSPVYCTMDAKVCPDGSYVGRVAPSCEFAACPVPSPTKTPSPTVTQTPSPSPSPTDQPDNITSVTVDALLAQRVQALAIALTPTQVLEDSRCPTDVMCIQAGTVRVRTDVEYNGAKTSNTFALGVPATFGARRITLVDVKPQPTSSTRIADNAYHFIFKVEKI